MLFVLIVVVFAGIALHRISLYRRHAPPPMSASTEVAVPGSIPPVPEATSMPAVDSTKIVEESAIPEAVIPFIDPFEDPIERRRMMDEQVRRMIEYARKADPDDPFSLTPEAIEEFRLRGDPIVF